MQPQQLYTVGICVLALIMNTANAAVLPLESRLGGLAYYDPNLDITWAANANINGLGDTWENQVAWAAGLDIGGVTGWRLPNADVNGDFNFVDCSPGGVAGCADNEMGYLYWEEGVTTLNPSPFSNVQGGGMSYWSSTEFGPFLTRAYNFQFETGAADELGFKDERHRAWPVRDGDVGVVPAPAAAWLFGSGLLGIISIARGKKAA